MPFKPRVYVDKFIIDYQHGIINNNSVLKIAPCYDTEANFVFRIIGIHKLTPEENSRGHALYMEVIDPDGKRVPDISVRWGWDGQRPNEPSPPVKLDKPINEPYGNIPVYGNQTVWAEVQSLYSDRIVNVHTRLPDEGTGNTYGHHSYLVVWQNLPLIITEPSPPPVTPPSNIPVSVILAKISAIEDLLNDIGRLLTGI